MPREPYLPPAVAEALNRREAEAAANGALRFGPALRVTLPTAGATRAVQHGMGTRPDGVFIARATGPVVSVEWAAWSETVAYLAAANANTIAELRFFTWAVPVSPTSA